MSTDAMILNAMKRGSRKHPSAKPLKEFRAKEQTDGKYHVTRHSGKPNEPAQEHTAADLDQVHDALEEHLGGSMSDDEVAPQQLGEGEPGMGGQV